VTYYLCPLGKKGNSVLCQRKPVKYAWIKEQHDFSVVLMCLMLDVSTSAYYDWYHRPKSARAIENEDLTEQVKLSQRKGCGTRVIKKALQRQGLRVSRRRIDRLMGQAELVCKTKKKFKAQQTCDGQYFESGIYR